VTEYIDRRRFVQTVARADLPKFIKGNVFDEIEATVKGVLASVETARLFEFLEEVHQSVAGAVFSRLSCV